MDIVIVCSGGCGRTTEGMTFETKSGEFKQVDESGVPEWTCSGCQDRRLSMTKIPEEARLTPEELEIAERIGNASVPAYGSGAAEHRRAVSRAIEEKVVEKLIPIITKQAQKETEARYDNDYMEMVREEGREDERRRIIGELSEIDNLAYDANDFTRRVCDLIVRYEQDFKGRDPSQEGGG